MWQRGHSRVGGLLLGAQHTTSNCPSGTGSRCGCATASQSSAKHEINLLWRSWRKYCWVRPRLNNLPTCFKPEPLNDARMIWEFKCLKLDFFFYHEKKHQQHLAAGLRVNKVLDEWKQHHWTSLSQEKLNTGVFLEREEVLYITCMLSPNETP